MNKAPTDCHIPDPTDAKADGQFQQRHRDGYSANLLEKAFLYQSKGWSLTAGEVQALVDEINRLRELIDQVRDTTKDVAPTVTMAERLAAVRASFHAACDAALGT